MISQRSQGNPSSVENLASLSLRGIVSSTYKQKLASFRSRVSESNQLSALAHGRGGGPLGLGLGVGVDLGAAVAVGVAVAVAVGVGVGEPQVVGT